MSSTAPLIGRSGRPRSATLGCMRAKDAIGRWGEALGARYLTGEGWELLDQNWRCRDGELDIVARDGAVVVFVEVKTRSSTAFGDPAEAVTRQKAARIRRIAVRWLGEHNELRCPELRFDVLSVVRPRVGRATLLHLRDAF